MPQPEHLVDVGELHGMRTQLRALRARERELKAEIRTLTRQDLDLQEALSALSQISSRGSSPSPDAAENEDDLMAQRHRQDVEATEEAAQIRLHQLADEEWAMEQQVTKQQVALRAAMLAAK